MRGCIGTLLQKLAAVAQGVTGTALDSMGPHASPREAWATPAPTRRALYGRPSCSVGLLFTMMHPDGERQPAEPMLSIPLDPKPS